ncbi:hypothetical protein [Streptomyces sp. NPDC047071]|uniref:hypothetical protein n=1 Tax=Streptomyces sp. NPDC047071 TaxID=3154808 RepID=UPI0034560556
MDVTALASAYEGLLTRAEAIGGSTPLGAETRADVEWRLCHIALADRIIATAAGEQIEGRAATVDNRPSMDPVRIAAIIDTTTHAQRVDTVRRTWAELRSVLESFTPDDARAQLTLRMHDRNGEYVSDAVLSWRTLVELRAAQHIPGYRDALAEALAA